ncbi:MAG: hypothetical protein LKG19_16445 [Saprospiraceae bacterium]|jgi:antitoxin component YwqK of YwqJK toxin-antitoxin module|nr:hypothetical protein [Saprospiraceae bacterium]
MQRQLSNISVTYGHNTLHFGRYNSIDNFDEFNFSYKKQNIKFRNSTHLVLTYLKQILTTCALIFSYHIQKLNSQSLTCLDSIPYSFIEHGMKIETIKRENDHIFNSENNYYSNGQIEQCFTWDDALKVFNYLSYFKNGKVEEKGYYNIDFERTGIFEKYYNDGKIKEQKDYSRKIDCILNYWNELGIQTIINGNGFKHYENEIGFRKWKYEYSYTNCRMNGIQKTYINGILGDESEYKDGRSNGRSIIRYPNGEIRADMLFDMETLVFIKNYTISDSVKCIVKFKYFYIDKFIYKDSLPQNQTYPICINELELSKSYFTPKFIKDNPNSDRFEQFQLTISKKGKVKKITPNEGFMTIGLESTSLIKKMIFKPARAKGKPVKSKIRILFDVSII